MFGIMIDEGPCVMLLWSQLLLCCSHCWIVQTTSKHEHAGLKRDTLLWTTFVESGAPGVPSAAFAFSLSLSLSGLLKSPFLILVTHLM